MSNDFGLSNIHLKIGVALMPIAAAVLSMAFVQPSTAWYMSGDVSPADARRHGGLRHRACREGPARTQEPAAGQSIQGLTGLPARRSDGRHTAGTDRSGGQRATLLTLAVMRGHINGQVMRSPLACLG